MNSQIDLRLKVLLRENEHLKERIASLEEERVSFHVNERVHSYQNDYVDYKALKEIKSLKKKCAKLEQERNHYINDGSACYELFEKYIGLYDKEEKTLFIHHCVDTESIYPYGCYNFDGDYACYSVRGSWDDWSNDYILQKRCVRDDYDGIYEGYVYYITVDNLIPGNEYEFKFKDVDGNWIEPVEDGESEDDAQCNMKLKRNANDVWNAVIRVR